MNDSNTITAGTKPRRRLRKLKTTVHTERAVIRIVPISASNAAFLSVMLGVSRLPVTAATLAPALGLLASLKRRRATRGGIVNRRREHRKCGQILLENQLMGGSFMLADFAVVPMGVAGSVKNL